MNTYVLIRDTDGQNLLNMQGLKYAIADTEDWQIDLEWFGQSEGVILDFATEQEFKDAFTLIVNTVAKLQSGLL